MNVSRFQLSLNHEDPDVIKQGLNEFQKQVTQELVEDTDHPNSYGYHGRQLFSPDYGTSDAIDTLYQSFASFLNPVALVLPISCLLSAYLQASPLVDELFVLWSLPDRDSVHLYLLLNSKSEC